MLYISWNQFKRQKSVCVFSILICMRDFYTWYLKEAIRYLYKKLYVSQSIFFFNFISQMNVNLRIWEISVRSLTDNYSRNLHSIKTWEMNLLVKVSLCIRRNKLFKMKLYIFLRFHSPIIISALLVYYWILHH